MAPESPASPPDRRLRPVERVQRPAEFQKVLKLGVCFRDPILRIHFLENGRELSRLGMVVSKKMGGAVMRNRLKRLFREVFRHSKWRLGAPLDVVFIPGSKAGPRGRSEYEAVFERFIGWHRSRLKKTGEVETGR